jgi:hypothetical protein
VQSATDRNKGFSLTNTTTLPLQGQPIRFGSLIRSVLEMDYHEIIEWAVTLSREHFFQLRIIKYLSSNNFWMVLIILLGSVYRAPEFFLGTQHAIFFVAGLFLLPLTFLLP